MSLPPDQMQAILGAMKGASAPQGPMQGASGMLKAGIDAHKKSNPTLWNGNGGFNWKNAMAPNQGWQTSVQPAGGAPAAPVAPLKGSIYDVPPQAPGPGGVFGSQTDPWAQFGNQGG